MPAHSGPAFIVEAAKDGQVEYWAAATEADKAVPAVLLIVGPQWTLRRTDGLLSADRVAALKMRAGSVRKLREQPADVRSKEGKGQAQ